VRYLFPASTLTHHRQADCAIHSSGLPLCWALCSIIEHAHTPVHNKVLQHVQFIQEIHNAAEHAAERAVPTALPVARTVECGMT
jgi:hypothetical protein